MTTTLATPNQPQSTAKLPAPKTRNSIASSINAHVATRLRAARNLAGMSQEKAGEILGVSFQQIQKYEKGINRVSVGNLAVFADAFGVPVTWFFEGAPGVEGRPVSGEEGDDVLGQMLSTPYGADLARDYLAIRHNQDRSVVAQVAHALARNGASC